MAEDNFQRWKDKEYEKQCQPSYWSKRHPNREDVINHFITLATTKNDEVLQQTKNKRNVPYGPSPRQKIDYFYADDVTNQKPRPVLVYIHGGYWEEGDKDMYPFVASVFVRRGFNCAVVGYDLCPNVKIEGITRQVNAAIAVVYEHFEQAPLVVCGHSAGAYLAAVAAGPCRGMIKDVVLVSGVFDLLPLLHTPMNNNLKLTEEEAHKLNSLLFKSISSKGRDENEPHGVGVHVCVGEDESPWFVKISEDFFKRVKDLDGVHSSYNLLSGHDHFSIIESLSDEQECMTSLILKLFEE